MLGFPTARVQFKFHRISQIIMWWAGCLLVVLFAQTVFAQDVEFLDPEQAFVLSIANHSPDEIDIHFQIAPEYYMYQERFHFNVSSDEAILGEPQFPKAERVYDPTFDKVMDVYRDQVTIRLPIQPAEGAEQAALPLPLTLEITSQGCADAGLCYSPITEEVSIQPVDGGFQAQGEWVVDTLPDKAPSASTSQPTAGFWSATSLSDTGLAAYLANAGVLEMLALAFLFGLLLSFTPCVLPMVPILLSVIAGQTKAQDKAAMSRRHGFAMAAVYVFGVSIVYTLLGVAAGLVGASLAIWLQTPWVLVPFAIILALLALSMFDVYTLQVPAGMQARLQGRLNKLPAGRYGGVFLMGMLSALIVGPCVAAPLAGILLFISQTGNVWLGGLTLFALAWGSGTLLLVVGASSGQIMPKAGAWMNLVKYGFGILLLATAWWMLSLGVVLPVWLWVLGWVLLALWLAFLFGIHRPLTTDSGAFSYLARAIGWLIAIWAVFMLVGLAAGAGSVLRPLSGVFVSQQNTMQPSLNFQRVANEAELDQVLATTTQPVMLDFYADWCVACHEMEQFTYTDPTVAQLMQQMLLVQVNVTDNTAEDRALLKRFQLFGPPGIIFFNAQGEQLESPRVIGFTPAERFSQQLEAVFQQSEKPA